ncbi:MAG: response regulator [Myxococcaceae bacterium]
MNVLLVEDDPGVREGLAEVATEFGTVREASRVSEAFSCLGDETFSLVLTDLCIDGDIVAGRRVAAFARERGARVVLMSASPKADILEALAGWTPDAVLEKPFQLEEIIRLFEQEKARGG